MRVPPPVMRALVFGALIYAIAVPTLGVMLFYLGLTS